jgi:drug/metabolite transporter (DMT)-like permease
VRREFLGITLLVCAHLFFGTTFAGNKFVINQGVNPILLGWCRVALATLCLLPLYVHVRRVNPWTRRDWCWVACIGLIAQPAAIMLEYGGTKYTTAANAALIISLEVLVSTCLAVLILKERVGRALLFGGVCTLLGVGLVLFEDIRHFQIHTGEALLGDFMVLLSVFGWSMYTVGSKRILFHVHVFYAYFWTSLFSFLALGAINAIQGTLGQVAQMSLPASLVTVYLGLFCSGLSGVLYYAALQRLPASLIAISVPLTPACGVVFAMVVLGESLVMPQIIGMLVILSGLSYAMWPRKES